MPYRLAAVSGSLLVLLAGCVSEPGSLGVDAGPGYRRDGSPSPVAELTPGTWYLAVDQRGAALVAQTQDGRRGVLQDTSGIQRG